MIEQKNIPKHWQIKKLGEVCDEIFAGGDVPKNNFSSTFNNEYQIPIFANGEKNKGLYGYTNISKVNSPSVTISARGTIGFALVRSKPFFPIVRLIVLVPNKDLNPTYLKYALDNSNIKHTGSSIPQLTVPTVKTMEIPLPPLPEQLLIVSKIEELLSDLENGKQQLQTAQQQLSVYRQCLLNHLVNGEAKNTLESVIEKLDQGWSPKCHNESSTNDKEWAVIKTTAVQSGYFQDNENKRLPENLTPRKQHELKKGDLLITRAGPRIRVGICCMVRKTRPNLLNCDKVYRMRINPKIATPEYVELILNSPKYSSEIEKMKTGISDSGVNLTQKGFVKMLIPIPSLKEQQRIVEETESKLTVCDKIEETITNSLQQAEMLKQSILKKAFEGKLLQPAPTGHDNIAMGNAHRKIDTNINKP